MRRNYSFECHSFACPNIGNTDGLIASQSYLDVNGARVHPHLPRLRPLSRFGCLAQHLGRTSCYSQVRNHHLHTVVPSIAILFYHSSTGVSFHISRGLPSPKPRTSQTTTKETQYIAIFIPSKTDPGSKRNIIASAICKTRRSAHRTYYPFLLDS